MPTATLAVALIVAAAGLPALLSGGGCPDTAALTVDCGTARGASVGDCLVCMSTKLGTACADADADAFCSGTLTQFGHDSMNF